MPASAGPPSFVFGPDTFAFRNEIRERHPDESDLYAGEAVYAGGHVVGRLRSAGWGYTVGKHIGFVYLPPALSAIGTPVEVEAFGARFAAGVAPDVLYDPAGVRLRQ